MVNFDRINLINEEQFHDIFLTEKMHYPEFLDKLKGDVSVSVFTHIQDMIKRGQIVDSLTVKCDCEYTDNLTINITILYGEDPMDEKAHVANYINTNDKLIDGKLINPKINLTVPAEENKVNYSLLRYVLSHELTHLYDDWMSIKNGNGNICANLVNMDTTSLVNRELKINDSPIKGIAYLAYVSLKTERQAFLSQTIQELEHLKCGTSNYREKSKETQLYKSIQKAYNEAMDFLTTSDDNALTTLSKYISTFYPKTNIPKIQEKNADIDGYRKKLITWAERTNHSTLKRYGSVIQYYIDQLMEERSYNNCILML